MTEGERVIVGVSGSVGSLAAVYRAVDEARRRDAVLVPVAAWLPAEDSLRPLSELEHAARRRLDLVFEQAFGGYPAGLLIHPQVVRAEAGRALVAAADRPTDLLVVGESRQGRLGVLRHGSVTRYCRSHAGCPVVVVPASELLASLERTVAAQQQATAARCRVGLGYLD